MSGHTTRGLRSLSMRVRLAVAAAVVAGGGAAGVIAVAANHSGAAAVQNTSYSHGYRHTISEQTALTMAATGWPKSTMMTNRTFTTLANMVPMRTFSTVNTMIKHQRTTLAAERGVVEFVSRKLLVLRSFNGTEHVWLLSQQRGTKFFNVAPMNNGMAAMTGGSLSSMTGGWMSNNAQMMMTVHGLKAGDIALVIGLKKHTSLIAKLVLFIQPMTVTPMPSATATTFPTSLPTSTVMPSMSATAKPTGLPTSTVTPTPTPTVTASSTATPTATASATVKPTATSTATPSFSGAGS